MVEGQHHGVSPKYLYQYANEAAWKEDHRRLPNGSLFDRTLGLALASSGEPRLGRLFAKAHEMRHSTDTYEHTINGLLQKRVELFHEAERLRDRMAEIKNDIGALDRTLTTLGYEGDLDAMMPRQKRQVLFGRGELSRAIVEELRGAAEPMTSRQIAQAIVALSGQDARDRKLVSELTKRVGKACRSLVVDERMQRKVDPRGNLFWSLRVG